MKTPAHSTANCLRVRLATLKSSSCSVALTAQKILRQTSWNSAGGLRVLSPSSNIFFPSICLTGEKLDWGESMPYCSKFPAHSTFKIGVPLLEQTRKHHDWEHQTSCADHLQDWSSPVAVTLQASRLRITPSKLEFSSGRLPKSLLVSYVSLVFEATCLALSVSLAVYLAHPGKPRPRGKWYPTAANFQRVTPSKLIPLWIKWECWCWQFYSDNSGDADPLSENVSIESETPRYFQVDNLYRIAVTEAVYEHHFL